MGRSGRSRMHEPSLSQRRPRLGCLLGDFQPFPPPDAVDPLHAHVPALVEEQAADAPVAVAAIPRRQPHDRLGQRGFVGAYFRLPALRRARLANNRARPTLRYGELRAHVIHARPLAGRAQYFPDRASFRICLSSVSSETAFFSRSFSRSSSFSRLA